jgi:Tc5 transposase DNA-binding domain
MRKENVTLEQKIEILKLKWYHVNGKNQTKAANHFDQKYPNLKLWQHHVSKWLKQEPKYKEQWEQSSGAHSHKAKQICQTTQPKVTEMLELWVMMAMAHNLLITGDVLCQKWTEFADHVGVLEDEQLRLSEGWLISFKERNNLKNYKQHGEAAFANSDAIIKERQHIQALIKEQGYQLKDIFNMDETGLFYGYYFIFFSQSQTLTFIIDCLLIEVWLTRNIQGSRVMKSD